VANSNEIKQKKTIFCLQYLQQSRLTLLQLEYGLDRLKMRVLREKCLTAECLVSMLVRFFLQAREPQLHQFLNDFQRANAQVFFGFLRVCLQFI
jgi:hypothetical protein